MENYNETKTDYPSNNNLVINDDIKAFLVECSKWAKFLAILSYIGAGLMILAAFFGFITSALLPYTMVPTLLVPIFYVVIGVLMIIPANFMYKFSDKIRRGIDFNEQETTVEAFENLKSLYKFNGIYAIVSLGLGVVSIFGAIVYSAVSFL